MQNKSEQQEKSTYVYAPKVVTDKSNNESTRTILELIEKHAPNQSDNPRINIIIQQSFIEEASPVNLTTPKSTVSAHKESEKTYQGTVIYNPKIEVQGDMDIKEASDRFDEIHRNRPKVGDNPKQNVVVSHSFTQVGQKLTVTDLLNRYNQEQKKSASENGNEKEQVLELKLS